VNKTHRDKDWNVNSYSIGNVDSAARGGQAYHPLPYIEIQNAERRFSDILQKDAFYQRGLRFLVLAPSWFLGSSRTIIFRLSISSLIPETCRSLSPGSLRCRGIASNYWNIALVLLCILYRQLFFFWTSRSPRRVCRRQLYTSWSISLGDSSNILAG
jgi:hypothetical protein